MYVKSIQNTVINSNSFLYPIKSLGSFDGFRAGKTSRKDPRITIKNLLFNVSGGFFLCILLSGGIYTPEVIFTSLSRGVLFILDYVYTLEINLINLSSWSVCPYLINNDSGESL